MQYLAGREVIAVRLALPVCFVAQDRLHSLLECR
jgi:hypothetical protein